MEPNEEGLGPGCLASCSLAFWEQRARVTARPPGGPVHPLTEDRTQSAPPTMPARTVSPSSATEGCPRDTADPDTEREACQGWQHLWGSAFHRWAKDAQRKTTIGPWAGTSPDLVPEACGPPLPPRTLPAPTWLTGAEAPPQTTCQHLGLESAQPRVLSNTPSVPSTAS